jgi:hypothetical protein
MVYTEIKGLGLSSGENLSKNADTVEYHEKLDEYTYRLNCGWSYLLALLRESENPNFIKNGMAIVFGNHSYDVNYKIEAEVISRMFNNEGWYPRLNGELKQVSDVNRKKLLKPHVTIAQNSNGIRIEYINLDPSPPPLLKLFGLREKRKYASFRKRSRTKKRCKCSSRF